jgi:sensor c-di-GMP phosphodiesterase-like protein
MKRKLLIQIVLLFCGCVLGLTIAYFIARNIQVHAGRADLNTYAAHLLSRAENLAHETDQAVALVSTDHLPFCSDQELVLMRDFVYNATDVKDIGRIKDDRLYCSTGVGRLSVPLEKHKPDFTDGQTRIFVARPLLISKQATGFIIETKGVSVVVNPEAYRNLDEGPFTYTGYYYDRPGGAVLRGFGHPIPLTQAEVIAGRLIERNGIDYRPLCSTHAKVCIVATEARADMLRRNRILTKGFEFAGGLLGTCLALIAVLMYCYQRSPEQQLRRAIRQGTLTLAYQPIIDLETETIVGAEALARWINDDGEPVRPDVFIALAEEKGFVCQITRLVVQRAIDELRDILAAGKFRVMLNIAAEDLTNPRFMLHLESCVQAARIPPSSVGIEITERSTVDQSAATEALTRLKRAGHPVFIDDFGTSYSSLAYLHLLDVDAIKIDRVFTQTIGTTAVTASVVPQILDMAAQLDLQVAVEGIETREQADYFRKAGRGILGQGWLFSKPVPAAQLRKLLQVKANTTASGIL